MTEISVSTSKLQGRRLASTRQPEADSFADGPTSLWSCWSGGPTTWLGYRVGGRRSWAVGSAQRTSVAQSCAYRRISTCSSDDDKRFLAVRVTVSHRHIPDYYYYSTVRCRYRHLPDYYYYYSTVRCRYRHLPDYYYYYSTVRCRYRHLPDYYYYSTVRCRYRHLPDYYYTTVLYDVGIATYQTTTTTTVMYDVGIAT